MLDKQTPYDKAKEQVEALCELEDGLSDWEMKFVDDIANRIKSNQPLSQKQMDKIDSIHSDKIG